MCHFNNYCKECRTEPYFQSVNPYEQKIILTVFSNRVHTGAYGQGYRARVLSVTDVLTAIYNTCHLVGLQSTIYQTERECILPIRRLTKVFRIQDPP